MSDSLLQTVEIVDSVALSKRVKRVYRIDLDFGEALDYPSNGELAGVEMPETLSDRDALEDDYGVAYANLIRALDRLQDDGHLPVRSRYDIHVWW